MVIYLGLNYLEHVLNDRRSVLSKCLLSVPRHLDQVAAYVHSGRLTDDKFRLPWKRASCDHAYLIEESTAVLEDSGKLVRHTRYIGLETFNMYIDDLVPAYGITFNLCEVVPSSNPSSQDIFSQDSVGQQIDDTFNENFEKENLQLYSSDRCELRLDILSEQDCVRDGPAALPSLAFLLSRQKSCIVDDPLLEGGKQRREDDIFGETTRLDDTEANWSYLHLKCTPEPFKETLSKMEFSSTEGELEDVLVLEEADPDLTTLATSLLASLTQSRSTLPVDKDPCVGDVILATFVKTEGTSLLESHGLSPEPTLTPTFLDINDLGDTEMETLCKKALLDSPIPGSQTHATRHFHHVLGPTLEPVSISPTKPSLLTEADKVRAEKKCWLSERFCDEIQTCRLPETCEAVWDAAPHPSCTEEARTLLSVGPDRQLGAVELGLHWQLLRLGAGHQLETLTLDTLDSPLAVAEVEEARKYSATDLDGCRDNIIKTQANACTRNTASVSQLHIAVPPAVLPAVQGTGPVPPVPVVGRDPLGDFMALRSMAVTKPTETVSGHNDVEDELPMDPEGGTTPNGKPAAGKDSDHSATQKTKSLLQTNRKPKHHVVTIKLSDEFCHVLELLEDAASMYMTSLKQSADIPPSSTFQSLTPSVTSFLLNQRQKSGTVTAADEDDPTLRSLLAVSALSGVADIATHCCLESAISYLNAVHDKYSTVLQGCLVGSQHRLVEMKVSLCQRQICHPKVVALCREVDTWLRKKRAKSKDNEQKIAILVKRNLPSLLAYLTSALKMGRLLSPAILDSPSTEAMIKMLDGHNCLVLETRLIDATFPWSQFSLVVEFEHEEDSEWRTICERQNIRHMALHVDTVDNREQQRESNWSGEFINKQIALVGSQKITKNIALLQLLETRQNLMFYERDYTLIEPKHLYFGDIDVDETACIVLQSLANLADDCTIQQAVTRVMALSVKYPRCWLVLYSPTAAKSYQLTSGVVSNIAKLEATIANFVSRAPDFEVKVLTSSSLAEVAGLVRSICEHCMTANKHRSIDDWLNRSWLTEEISQKERFLLMFPCLSSFNAQLMLAKMAMGDLLSSNIQAMSDNLPWIHRNILTNFHKQVNSLHGLDLRLSCLTEADHSNLQKKPRLSCALTTEDSEVYDTVGDINTQVCQFGNENVCTSELKNSLYGEAESNVTESDTSEANKEQHDHVFEDKYDQSGNIGDSEVTNSTNENQSAVCISRQQTDASIHAQVIKEKPSGQTCSATDAGSNSNTWAQLDNFIAAEASNTANKVEGHRCDPVLESVSTPAGWRGYLTSQGLRERDLHAGSTRRPPTGDDDKQTSRQSWQNLPSSEARYPGSASDIQRQPSSHNVCSVMEDSLSRSNPVDNVTSEVGAATDASWHSYQEGQWTSIEYNHGLHPATSRLHSSDYNTLTVQNDSFINYPHFPSDHEPVSRVEPEIDVINNEMSESRLLPAAQYTSCEYQPNKGVPHRNQKRSTDQVCEEDIPYTLDTCGQVREAIISIPVGDPRPQPMLTQGVYDVTDAGGGADYYVSSAQLIEDMTGYGGGSGAVAHQEEGTHGRLDCGDNIAAHFSTDAHNILLRNSLIANCTKMKEKNNIINILEQESSKNVPFEIINPVLDSVENRRYRPIGSSDNSKSTLWSNDVSNHHNISKYEFETRFPLSNNNKYKPHTEDLADSSTRDTVYSVRSTEFPRLPKYVGNNSNQSVRADTVTGPAHVKPPAARVSMLPDFIYKSTPTKEPGVRSWEDDLRETTRKFLANSQQFSSFDHYPGRHHAHKVSIGLAQPLQRETTHTDSVKVLETQEDARLMKQSNWATDDSPPMDLDFDTAPFTASRIPNPAAIHPPPNHPMVIDGPIETKILLIDWRNRAYKMCDQCNS